MIQCAMEVKKIKEIIEKDYKSKSTVSSILNGNRKPNADLRYKYEKEHDIPFDGWGKELRNHIDEACPCCGTILKEAIEIKEKK